MKTFIGAIIGVIIIVVIVVLARHGETTLPATTVDTSSATNSMNSNPSDTTSATTTPATTNTAPVTKLEVTTTKEGTGVAAVAGDTVSMNYTGMLTNGTVFDSNVDPKFQHVEPFSFTLGQNMVIQGWEQGVLGMKAGEKRHFVIPSSLAYGPTGQGPIPPNATLMFDVELVSITHKK